MGVLRRLSPTLCGLRDSAEHAVQAGERCQADAAEREYEVPAGSIPAGAVVIVIGRRFWPPGRNCNGVANRGRVDVAGMMFGWLSVSVCVLLFVG